MSLQVDIEKKLGNFTLKLKFEAENEVFALLGASGSGKSLTLKCIAGIEKPDRGRIVLDDRVLFDSEKGIDLPPQERRTGYLFQQYALFPNMTVEQNIACGMRRDLWENRGLSRREKKAMEARKCREMMESMRLTGLEKHYPHQLSGGQQQRTALARILAGEPDILMLDEAFSALDEHLRFSLQQEIKPVLKAFGKTVLLISHDRGEVFRLSDSIAVLDKGGLLKTGSREQVFSDPGTVSAARLTGCRNIAEAVFDADSGQSEDGLSSGNIRVPGYGLSFTCPKVQPGITHAGIKAESIRPAAVCRAGSGPVFRCRVAEEIENPDSVDVMLCINDGDPFCMEIDKRLWQELRAPELDICIPEDALLLLRG